MDESREGAGGAEARGGGDRWVEIAGKVGDAPEFGGVDAHRIAPRAAHGGDHGDDGDGAAARRGVEFEVGASRDAGWWPAEIFTTRRSTSGGKSAQRRPPTVMRLRSSARARITRRRRSARDSSGRTGKGRIGAEMCPRRGGRDVRALSWTDATTGPSSWRSRTTPSPRRRSARCRCSKRRRPRRRQQRDRCSPRREGGAPGAWTMWPGGWGGEEGSSTATSSRMTRLFASASRWRVAHSAARARAALGVVGTERRVRNGTHVRAQGSAWRRAIRAVAIRERQLPEVGAGRARVLRRRPGHPGGRRRVPPGARGPSPGPSQA